MWLSCIMFLIFGFAVAQNNADTKVKSDSIKIERNEAKDIEVSYQRYVFELSSSLVFSGDIPSGQYRGSVSFKVQPDGTVTDFKITKDPGHGLGDAVLKAFQAPKFQKMKDWKPLKNSDGKPIITPVSLPFIVTIKS